MNFLKRAGAILMVVAIFASSCNKYDDDFEQINNKLDLLAGTVQGVTTLNADLTALKTQVTALQTAVAALPAAQTAQLKVETDKILLQISAITTTLGTVATAGTTTKAVVDQLKLDLAALTLKVNDENAAMTIKLNGLGTTDAAQTQKLNDLITANATLLTKIAAIETNLAALAGTATDEATALTIGGLQAMLDAQKIMLEKLLANSNMINDAVSITSDAEVTFYMTKIGQWIGGGMVQGSVVINTTNISAAKQADLNIITDNIIAIIGTGTLSITTTANKPLSFAKLASTTGSVTVTAGADVAFTALTSVGGGYSVSGMNIGDAALASVTGAVVLNYDGGYDQPNLLTTGAITLTDFTTNATADPAIVGTLKVDFSGLTAATSIQTGATPGTVVFASATSVLLGQVPYVSVTANAANTVNLAYSAAAGSVVSVSVNATKAASSITLGLKKVAGTTQNLTIVGSSTSTVVLTNLVSVSGTTAITAKNLTANAVTTLTGIVGLTNVTPVSLPALTTAGNITAGSAVTFTAPKLVTTGITVTLGASTTSVELATTPGTNLLSTGASFINLTVKALDEVITVPGTVETAVITGKNKAGVTATPADWTAWVNGVVATAASNTLKSLTLGGYIKQAAVTSTGLTALHTSGVVNSLTVSGNTNTALTSLDLMHTHYPSGPGSELTISGNTSLTSLTTSTNYPKILVITGNTELATLVLTSNTNAISVAGAVITIGQNKLTGTFVASKPSVGSDPFVEATLTAAFLAPIKALIAQGYGAGGFGFTGTGINLSIDLYDADPATAAAQNLSGLMATNYAAYNAATNPTVIDATAGVNTAASPANAKEVAIIQ